jgi:metallophosphoesterase superfamily enzyme
VLLDHTPLFRLSGHPALRFVRARVVAGGRSVRRRCFVTDGERLVLPAFGAYAGGLNVRDAAFSPLFPRGLTAHVMGEERVFAFAQARCLGD